MKRIGLICLTLLLALATLGVGYAYYTQNLYVTGSVTTADFTIGGGDEDDGGIEDPPDIPGVDWGDDGMSFTVAVDGGEPDPANQPLGVIYPYGVGAYPGYTKVVNFPLVNPATGFPMKIYSVVADGHDLGPIHDLADYGSEHTATFRVTGSPLGGTEDNMIVTSNLGAQDKFGVGTTLNVTMTFTVPESLTEKTPWTGSFQVIITVAQENDP